MDMRTEQARPVRLEDYRPPDWLVESVELDVALDPTATRVRAALTLRPNGNGAAPAPLMLDGEALKLRALKLDGAALPPEQFVVTPDQLTIAQPPQRRFRLEIETVVDPSANTQLLGLYRSGAIYCTQCEAEGFRRITYFPDRPDVMAVYTTRIEAEKADAAVLLANGNLVASGDVPDTTRHFAVWHDPFPKPSYLFALVGGKLACVEDRFRTTSGREVALRIYVEPGRESRCAYAMDSLKRAMRWDETAFGREYDLDIFMIVAVSDFNMGAMENKGLNVFNDKYVLASPETATDNDFERIEAIIAHEYFHNWTGNRITCRDLFQLCLKEGLTVFRDQEFSADQRSRAVERISDVRGLRAHQFVEDAGPLAHPVRPTVYREINNFYAATVYEKGAELVRMINTLLGPKNFRRGMDLYFVRHDGQAATVEQFVQCFADVSGADLRQFMLWYSQAGTPEVAASGSYDAGAKTYRLELTQTVPPTPGQSNKDPMVIPLVIGLVGGHGCDLPLKPSNGRAIERGLLTLSKTTESIEFAEIGERPVLSLNRRFSAPIRLVLDLSAEDLRFLAAYDSDAFNRWQAVQTLANRLLDNYRRLSDTGPYRSDAASAGRRALRNTCLDLMVATRGPEGISLAAAQYRTADNMTDRLAALSTLSLWDVPERAAALDDFYGRYAHDPLVIDKWLALQAAIPEPATLERVKALTTHRAFSLANPNRVRALIHAFALTNQKEFNRADGAGYDFIVDIALRLDAKNPQLAARLLSAFKSWRTFEPGRRTLAEAALRRAAAAQSLSADVTDIVQRALGSD